MCETTVVGQDKLLALDVDVIDIVSVDDEAPADTDEQVAIAAKLLMNHGLNLPQLEGEHTRLVVSLHKIAVVAIRRDKDNLVGRDAHQVCGSRYDQILLEHNAAKVATPSECKYRLFVEMYEICRKMYEMINQALAVKPLIPSPAKVFRPQRSVCLVAVSATGYHSATATVRASLWPTLH